VVYQSLSVLLVFYAEQFLFVFTDGPGHQMAKCFELL
jgi:hypothetical protein